MEELGNPAPEADVIANPDTETDEVVTLLSDEETADEETPKDEEPQPRKLKVKIDGQELEVDEEEAARGYQRQADYSRNMQRVQAEMQQAQQARDMYQERIEQFIPDQVAKLQRLQSELNQLATEDPALWVAKQQEFNTEVQRYQMAESEKNRMNDERNAQQQATRHQLLQRSEQALTEAIPEWKNPETRKTEIGTVANIIRGEVSKFFGPETDRIMSEIDSGYYGPLPIVLARKAMLYDNLMQKVAARKSSKSEDTQAPAPVARVRTSGGGSKDPEKMSAEDWVKWREGELRKRA